MSASDHLSQAQHYYSATHDPAAKKWQGWVALDNGSHTTKDPAGFVHPTKAAAVKAVKAQHPPKKMVSE